MVPKLRFESYFDNWLPNKLSDLAVDNTLSNGVFNDPLNVGSGYKLINVVNMYKEPCIDENDLSLLTLDEKTFRKNQVFFGDLFFTRSSLVKEGIAWSNIYLGHSEDVTFDGHLIKLTPDFKKINPKFLYFCLKTSSVRKQLIESGKTATMTTIGQSDVGKTLVFIPQLKEQTKIANLLSSVDEKITLLNKQYNLLSQYKKGMMQKIFSQEVRFKDEYGEEFPEWEESLLSERISVQGGFAFKSQLFSEMASTKVLRIGDISEEIDLSVFSGVFSTETPAIRYQVNKGDFVMALSGATFGKMGLIKCGSAFLNQRVATFRLLDNTTDTLSFYYYYMSTREFNNYIKSIPTASAQPNISNKDIELYLSYIPTQKEQNKIAKFLSALDDKISTKKAELDKLKTWKQGLLQQMFV
ncbi:restriction endonuclease subunit S [Citrobacter amalonaticus]|uniref:restriction endonuclease subunit S n=1 Tax=Citrobacter amalonaticus TaxID=35703 RepID=UPI00339C5814